MKIDVNNIAKNLNTPLTAPAYPMPPYKFVNREYLNIIYRTDEKALRAAVPEPLEITEPLVKFEVMWMPDVSGLGAYTEAGQVIPVQFNGEEGDYVHSMYVDNFPRLRVVESSLPIRKSWAHPSCIPIRIHLLAHLIMEHCV